jgi:hypothetical protein
LEIFGFDRLSRSAPALLDQLIGITVEQKAQNVNRVWKKYLILTRCVLCDPYMRYRSSGLVDDGKCPHSNKDLVENLQKVLDRCQNLHYGCSV